MERREAVCASPLTHTPECDAVNRTRPFIRRPWLIVPLATLIYTLIVVSTQGSPLALVTLGTRFSDGDLQGETGTEGYDGQFVYYIARDPGDAERFLDVPAYRFQRILLPILGRVLAFGQNDLLPWSLLLVNLVALAAGTYTLEHLLEQYGTSRWYALGYGLSLPALGAARLSLPEPLAYALALGGVALAFEKRVLWSAVFFVLAAFAKETTLIMAAGIGLWLLWRRQWLQALLFALISLIPFGLWQIALAQRFGSVGVGSGGAMATPFEIIPFAGIFRIWFEGSFSVFLAFGLILLPFVVLPTVWGLARVARDFTLRRVGITTLLLLTTAGIMLFVPFSTYREPLGILRFIAGLQLAAILYAAQHRDRRILMYSTFWALTSLFVIVADIAAGVKAI